MTDDEIATIDPEHTPTGDELAVLTAFLDYYRAVIVRKAQGLTRDEMNARLGPSEMTIGGVIKHLAFAEDIWFDHRLAGNEIGDPWARVNWEVDPDWEFHSAVDDEPEALLRLYDAACARSRAAAADVGNLDAVAKFPNRRDRYFSLRWILVHMIEETARHAGHADLIRESIDGTTGD
ncbi:MAG TPA: DinB family protein [Desertimonas sp.]|nr:DinB family protein [Desertimonas sp.]